MLSAHDWAAEASRCEGIGRQHAYDEPPAVSDRFDGRNSDGVCGSNGGDPTPPPPPHEASSGLTPPPAPPAAPQLALVATETILQSMLEELVGGNPDGDLGPSMLSAVLAVEVEDDPELLRGFESEVWSTHRREVVYETSQITVVDTKIEPAPWTRSLYFKSTPTVTQSEIELEDAAADCAAPADAASHHSGSNRPGCTPAVPCQEPPQLQQPHLLQQQRSNIGLRAHQQRSPVHNSLMLVPQQVLGLGLLLLQPKRGAPPLQQQPLPQPLLPIDKMRSALVIGAGGGAVPMALRRICTAHVDAVDMSPDVVAAAHDMFGCNNHAAGHTSTSISSIDGNGSSTIDTTGTGTSTTATTTTINTSNTQMAAVELLAADGLDVLLGKVQFGARTLQDYDYILVDVDAGVQESTDAGGALSCTAPHPAFLAPEVLGALARARDQGRCTAIAINAVGSRRWIKSTAKLLLGALGEGGATVVSAAGNVLFLWGAAELPTSASGMQSAMDADAVGVEFAGPGLRTWVDAVAELEQLQHRHNHEQADGGSGSGNGNGSGDGGASDYSGSGRSSGSKFPDYVVGLADFVNDDFYP